VFTAAAAADGRGIERALSGLCPYCAVNVRSTLMEVAARLTSKGQVTIPKAVRDALGLSEGDSIVFRIDGERALLARTSDLLELAGSVSVPAEKRGVAWHEVRRRTRLTRAAARQ
jgi:antitoxin PrlF